MNKNSRIISETYNFSINENLVQVLATDNFQSFTFLVERENNNPNILENYVYTIFSNGGYTQMLISYPILHSNNGYNFDINNASVTYIQDDTLLSFARDGISPCNNWTEEIIEWDSNAGECVEYNCTAGGNHAPGESCNGDPDQQPYIVCSGGWVVTGCISFGGGTGGSGDSDSSGGGSSGNTDSNNDSNENNTIPNTDNNITPEDQLLPVIPFYFQQSNNNPCAKITQLLDNSTVKGHIQNLNTPATLNLNYEKGFNISDGSSSLNITPNDGSPGNTSIKVRIDPEGNLMCFIHSHFNGSTMSPLFTIEDLKTLNAMYQYRRSKQKNLDDLTAIVVSSGGVYAMVIKDYTKFAAEGNKLHTGDFENKLDEYYENYPKSNLMYHTATIEKLVLKQLTQYGVGLFKANNDLSGWSELTLNENNETIPNPCN